MTRVVRELEIGVGVVDRSVAALRVVADVEGVVRAGDDREPCLVGGVEDCGRDLADASAEPGLEFAVDDHGRFPEALVRGARSGRPVERECLTGCDQVLVDQVGHELHVVDAIRLPAVERLVARDEPLDVHRLRLGGRPVGVGPLNDQFGRAQRRLGDECGQQHGVCTAGNVEHVARTVGDHADAALRVDRPVGIRCGRSTRFASAVNQALAPAPPI